MTGGTDKDGNILRDGWEWDGTSWNPTTDMETPLSGHTLTFNPIDGSVWVIGGANNTGFSKQTWRYDGFEFKPGPDLVFAVAHHSATYSPKHQTLVVHGGIKEGFVTSGDTYAMNRDLSGWSKVGEGFPVHSGVLEASGNSLTHLGGLTSVFVPDSFSHIKRLELDTGKWNEVGVVGDVAFNFANPASVIDPVTGRLTIFGGHGPNGAVADVFFADPDTTSWGTLHGSPSILNTNRKPPPASGGRAASLNGKMYHFGGSTNSGPLGNMYEFNPNGLPRSTTALLGGCNDGPKIVVQNVATLGSQLIIDVLVTRPGPLFVLNGQSKTDWGSFKLPLNLDSFGLPGCTLQTDPFLALPLVHVNGVATLNLSVPNDPALQGAMLYHQALQTLEASGVSLVGSGLSALTEHRAGR